MISLFYHYLVERDVSLDAHIGDRKHGNRLHGFGGLKRDTYKLTGKEHSSQSHSGRPTYRTVRSTYRTVSLVTVHADDEEDGNLDEAHFEVVFTVWRRHNE